MGLIVRGWGLQSGGGAYSQREGLVLDVQILGSKMCRDETSVL